MAEALTNFYRKDEIKAYSAGTLKDKVNPYAIKVINEFGIDMKNHYSKEIDEVINLDFNLVVTVCDNAKESCPIFPKKIEKIHHSFDDPPHLSKYLKDEEEILKIYRRVRDEIKEFIIKL
jgi:arsenate reductase